MVLNDKTLKVMTCAVIQKVQLSKMDAKKYQAKSEITFCAYSEISDE